MVELSTGVAVGIAVLVFLLIFCCCCAKPKSPRASRRRSVRQPTSPAPQPQDPVHTRAAVGETRQPPSSQNQGYQTPLSERIPFPPPSAITRIRSPTTPPITYYPQAMNIRIHHVHPHSQPPQQQTSNQQFSSEDLLSFEATGEDKDAPCPICLGPLEEEPISTGQCLHLMHTSCLKSWLAKDAKSACPICRLPYSDDLHPAAATGLLPRTSAAGTS